MPAPENGPGAGSPSAGDTTTLPALPYVPYQKRRNAPRARVSSPTPPAPRSVSHAAPAARDVPRYVPRSVSVTPPQPAARHPQTPPQPPAPPQPAKTPSPSPGPPPLRKTSQLQGASRTGKQREKDPGDSPVRLATPEMRTSTPRTPGTPEARMPMHPHSYASQLALQSAAAPRGDSPESQAPARASPQREAPRLASAHRAYRRGFQPMGVIRNQTESFLRLRERFRAPVELEEQRLERRLVKLAAIYNEPVPADEREDTGLFGLLPRAEPRFVTQRRAAEQAVVKWQDDHEATKCCICRYVHASPAPLTHSTPFSLAVRRHHCRTCGRLVCSSPHLPHILQAAEAPRAQRCSTLVLAEPRTHLVSDLPSEVRPEQRKEHDRLARHAFRICAECRDVLLRLQYASRVAEPSALVTMYHVRRRARGTAHPQTLVALQKEIEAALPDFHEMVLGLQKSDTAATLASSIDDSRTLQHDAAQARKELLVRFARYDQLAKQIYTLHTDTAQPLQKAIYARATLFLQKHMFPLQSIPRRPAQEPEQGKQNVALHGQVSVLQEQETLLSEYLATAVRTRNLEDAASLRESLEEVRAEIRRLNGMMK